MLTTLQIERLADWAAAWASYVGDVGQRTPIAPFTSEKPGAAGTQDALRQTFEAIAECLRDLADRIEVERVRCP